jgi:hypothetical protein
VITVLCPNGHPRSVQAEEIVLADLAGGFTAITYCPTCKTRTYTSVTREKVDEEIRAGAHEVMAGLLYQSLAKSHSAETVGHLTPAAVELWADILDKDADTLIRAWLNAGVTA